MCSHPSLLQVRRHFPPEFLNRVDEFIIFEPLTAAQIRQVGGGWNRWEFGSLQGGRIVFLGGHVMVGLCAGVVGGLTVCSEPLGQLQWVCSWPQGPVTTSTQCFSLAVSLRLP